MEVEMHATEWLAKERTRDLRQQAAEARRAREARPTGARSLLRRIRSQA